MNDRKVILITGSATSLASEIVKDLSKDNLLIVHYNKSVSNAKKLKENYSVKLIQADFNTANVYDFLNEAYNIYNRIDVIINAASIFEKVSIDNLNREIIEKYNNIHSTFPLLLTIEYYKLLKIEKRKGVVINITDAMKDYYNKDRIPYYLSKNALSFQTKVLASSLSPILRVNEIAPGFVLPKIKEEDYFKKIEKNIPYGITKVNEIIKAIKYIIDSEQITGICLNVDSGLSILPKKI